MSNLPLFTLFNRLRRAGFPLGVDEYMLALRALQGGFGLQDVAALKRLCRTLWVKSPQEERLFEYQFEQMRLEWQEAVLSSKVEPQVLASPPTAELPELSPKPDIPQSPPDEAPAEGWFQKLIPSFLREIGREIEQMLVLGDLLAPPSPEPSVISEQSPVTSHHSPVTSHQSPVTSHPMPLVEGGDEMQTVQAIQLAPLGDEIGEEFFHFAHDYLPVGLREMEQSWRYLRFRVREGAAVEFDVQATVKQIAADGFLLKPVLMPRRINRAHLLLLLDQKGSMVPFHALSERLRDTALLGGKLGKANVYYFHNFPVDYLYHDRGHLEPQKIDELLPQLNPQRTAILIFSDGGAARGGYNSNRLKHTKKFIERLREHVQQLAWLNPMPHERWYGTTAGEIADIVPMFEMSRRGMDQAIDVLKGRAR